MRVRVLAALDKFKGTATSADLGAAVVRAARACGAQARSVVLADGGDGLLEVFGGPDRTTTVTGPDGRAVSAAWRLDGADAVLESARASGLVLAGGTTGNDPMTATSRGTGELVEAAVAAGARRIVLGVGGSACTDGGLPALDALRPETLTVLRDGTVTLLVCCDVTTRYEDAAAEFAPQKGATPAQVTELTGRLTTARETLRRRLGVDVGELPGAGAAGGLAGAFAAAGATLRPGFDVVAERTGLAAAVAGADLVVTGEGRLDRTSFAGKVVGGVTRLAAAAGVRTVIVAGEVDDEVGSPDAVSLTARFGRDRALADPLGCVADVVADVVSGLLRQP